MGPNGSLQARLTLFHLQLLARIQEYKQVVGVCEGGDPAPIEVQTLGADNASRFIRSSRARCCDPLGNPWT